LGFAEGVNFDRDGMLYCVDISGGAVCRLQAGGALTAWVNTGGGPNGSRFGPAGDLFVADCVNRNVLRIATATGDTTVYADQWDGKPLAGPNDLCFGPDGTLYFTDPAGSSPANPIGGVYAVAPDRSVARVATGLAFPNGLAVTPDGITLIVAETHTGILHRFSLEPASLYQELPPLTTLSPAAPPPQESGPDGMAFGDDGNLYVAHFGTGVVRVVAPSGNLVASLPAGGPTVTNVAFWRRSLYVTEGRSGSVYRLDIGVGEHPPFMRPW
jgi:gluconolactonase